jgi:hypothetical protein
VDNVCITLLDRPFITYEPMDATVTEGQLTGFTALAVGPEPITYQWYHSAPLVGQTNYWLQLASAQLGDAGNYFVVLSNSFGSTTSRVAQLVVNGIPPGFADTQFEAVAINDRGQIVVNANMQTTAAHYALRWQDGNWQRLQDREWSGGEYQGWTVSVGINALGYIAGYSAGATWDYFAHAWVFDPHSEPDTRRVNCVRPTCTSATTSTLLASVTRWPPGSTIGGTSSAGASRRPITEPRAPL